MLAIIFLCDENIVRRTETLTGEHANEAGRTPTRDRT